MKWFLRNWTDVALALWQHIAISLTALTIAFALSLVIGMVAARREKLYGAVMTVSGILYTIPTLAFLAFLIPVVGLGRSNAIITMVAFSLMILIRSVATGIREVPADVIDAARGMGMNAGQIMRRIELPLALPLIVAGLRVSAVTVISVTVVAAYVNAGGLGTLIFNGIASDHPAKIWAGALTVCALAVVVDLLLALTERKLKKPAGGLTMLPEAWNYILTHPAQFWRALGVHISLSASALLIAALICIPAGIAVARRSKLSLAVVNVSNVGRTLPSLAVLALVMPLLGTGFAPALFALTLIALPPIVTHTITAMRGVDADAVDAAIGMGMTRSSLLWQVELPMALPVIFAGLRTAAVQVISGAVLAAFIGGGGLGDFITAGIAMMAVPQLLVGAVPVTLLALATDFLFGALQRRLTPQGLKNT